MTKPDWKYAPKWANWLAKDKDGTWFWYAEKPEAHEDDGIWDTLIFKICQLAQKPEDWKDTLEERPKQ